MINSIKVKLQSTIIDIQGDTLIVNEVLEGSDVDMDSLARHAALQTLNDNLISLLKHRLNWKG